MDHWAESLFVGFWKDALLAEYKPEIGVYWPISWSTIQSMSHDILH